MPLDLSLLLPQAVRHIVLTYFLPIHLITDESATQCSASKRALFSGRYRRGTAADDE